MRKSADEAVTLGLTGESVAWYQVQLGDLYFNGGQIEVAAKQYATALDLFENYYLALAGLGKVRAAQGQYDEAIALYQQAVAGIPQPRTLAALGDLYTKTGQVEKAQLRYDTVEFIAELAAINKQVYNRQLALFYADHDLNLEEALKLASRELVLCLVNSLIPDPSSRRRPGSSERCQGRREIVPAGRSKTVPLNAAV